jgi:site-specific DNA recombinase
MTRVALYARYSDDKQSAASIEDQFRVCQIYADRQGWTAAGRYSDAAISGATMILRPGVRSLLHEAMAGKFDVVLAEALDRLSRDQEDIAALFKRLRFAGVPIITLSEGEISELHVGLKGTMNALFLKELSAKTHRGLRGRVEAGKASGNKCYGYRVVRAFDATGKVTTGEREIIPEQAEVVRGVFRDYAAGKSPRQIALALNAAGIPAPRGRAWSSQTLRGKSNGVHGILNNPLYVGRMIWNRARDLRDPDTGGVKRRANPESEWVHAGVPHLRIIDDALWEAARTRQEEFTRVYEQAVADGKRLLGAASAARRPMNLLSGLVACGVCGGAISRRGNGRMACLGHTSGKGCTNKTTVVAERLEIRVLAGLRDRLLTPQIAAEAMRSFIEETNRLNHERRASEAFDRQRLDKARKAAKGLLNMIEDGEYTPGMVGRLRELENEVAAIEAALAEAPRDIPDIHPNVAELYRRKVERLTEALADPDNRTEAATALRALIEKIVVTPTERRGEHDVRLFGDLETILAWAEDRKAFLQAPLRLSFRHGGDGVALKGIEGSHKQKRRDGRKAFAAFAFIDPSSGPSGHLLPQGEKDERMELSRLGHALVRSPEQRHLQARAVAAGRFQRAFGHGGFRGEAFDRGLLLAELFLVLATDLVLGFLHGVQTRAQLLGPFLGALHGLVLGHAALGQLVGAFDGGGAGGIDAGVALTQAVRLFFQRADPVEGALQGDVEVAGAAFHGLLMSAGLGKTRRDLAVHLFQLIGAARGGLEAGLQGRDLGAACLDLAFQAADGAAAVGLMGMQGVLDRLDAPALGGDLGFEVGLDARQSGDVQAGLVDALPQHRGFFTQQGVVLVGAGQGGLGVTTTGVDVLGLETQTVDVLHQVLDAGGGVAQRGVEAGNLQVRLQQGVAQAVDLEGVVLKRRVLGLATGVGFTEGSFGGGQAGADFALLGLDLGDHALSLVVVGPQGDQLGVLAAAGLELLGHRTADLGDQRLDGLQVLHDPTNAVETTMNGLVALADGLGGFDLMLHGFDPGVLTQNGRLAVLVLARILRQQSHVAHLRPVRVRRDLNVALAEAANLLPRG